MGPTQNPSGPQLAMTPLALDANVITGGDHEGGYPGYVAGAFMAITVIPGGVQSGSPCPCLAASPWNSPNLLLVTQSSSDTLYSSAIAFVHISTSSRRALALTLTTQVSRCRKTC